MSAEWVLAGAVVVMALALIAIVVILYRLGMEVEEKAWIETDLDLVIGPDDIEWNRDENHG